MPRHIARMGSAIAPMLRWLLVAVRILMKVVVAGAAALAVGLLLAFVSWDVGNFQPQRPQIDKLIAAATEEERNPPETIVRLVRVAHGHRGVAAAASMLLMRDSMNPLGLPERIRMGDWHVRGPLSWLCVKLHLSEREQITLLISRSYMGRAMWGIFYGLAGDLRPAARVAFARGGRDTGGYSALRSKPLP
jgi:hypothetical protein